MGRLHQEKNELGVGRINNRINVDGILSQTIAQHSSPFHFNKIISSLHLRSSQLSEICKPAQFFFFFFFFFLITIAILNPPFVIMKAQKSKTTKRKVQRSRVRYWKVYRPRQWLPSTILWKSGWRMIWRVLCLRYHAPAESMKSVPMRSRSQLDAKFVQKSN